MTENATGSIWLYDGVCVLCSAAVQYVLRHERDHAIRFVAIQSGEGRRLAAHHGIDADDPATFLFIENSVALEKSAGVMALAAHVGGPGRLVLLGRFLPRRLRDVVYDFVARRRYRIFGKLSACMTPDAAMRRRFVLPE